MRTDGNPKAMHFFSLVDLRSGRRVYRRCALSHLRKESLTFMRRVAVVVCIPKVISSAPPRDVAANLLTVSESSLSSCKDRKGGGGVRYTKACGGRLLEHAHGC